MNVTDCEKKMRNSNDISTLPNAPEAERDLIGLCLVDGRIPDEARELATTDFYTSFGKEMWTAILELDADGVELNPFEVMRIAKRNGPTVTLAELTQSTAGMVHMNATALIRPIKEAAISRYVMRELYATIERVQTGQAELTDVRGKLAEIDEKAQSRGAFRTFGDILETEVATKLDDLAQGITRRIPTGFPAIDRTIGGGLSPSDVVVLAAVTGGGKSAFALQLAWQVADAGYPVAFVSGEMTDEENAARALSQMSKFHNLNALMHIDAGERRFLADWSEAIKHIPLYFDSRSSDIASIAKSLRYMVEEKKIHLLVVDYLQLFKTGRNDAQKRTERIAECSQELKRLAIQYKIALVEVVQFNREGAKSLKPSMNDLADSSQIEKDASLIWIIDRTEGSDEVLLRLDKGRNVGKCEIAGRFNSKTLRFEF